MDKKIDKMQRDTSKLLKEEKSFKKADKRRDKLVEKGREMKRKGC